MSQPVTGADQPLDVNESDNSDNAVTDLYTHTNTPTYNDDLKDTSHTDEEIFTQNNEDDVTSSVLELLTSTEYDHLEMTNTNTTRGINSSEFEELDVRGMSGKESNVERQDYAQSRSLKLGEGGKEGGKKEEEEEEEVS